VCSWLGGGLRARALSAAGRAAGANAVPVDIFHSKETPAALRAMVQSAVDANMNMLRVWGGGLYYPDAFYDACDQMGVLVWQEAMFACSLYPSNSAFLDSVRGAPGAPAGAQPNPTLNPHARTLSARPGALREAPDAPGLRTSACARRPRPKRRAGAGLPARGVHACAERACARGGRCTRS